MIRIRRHWVTILQHSNLNLCMGLFKHTRQNIQIYDKDVNLVRSKGNILQEVEIQYLLSSKLIGYPYIAY